MSCESRNLDLNITCGNFTSLTELSIVAWNSLPNSIVTSPNTNLFQSRLDRYWANENIIYDFRDQSMGPGVEVRE